jgi:hypothetical protein
MPQGVQECVVRWRPRGIRACTAARVAARPPARRRVPPRRLSPPIPAQLVHSCLGEPRAHAWGAAPPFGFCLLGHGRPQPGGAGLLVVFVPWSRLPTWVPNPDPQGPLGGALAASLLYSGLSLY